MPTPLKDKTISELKERLTNSGAVYLVDYQGTNVAKLTNLRKQFRNANSEFMVVKNTLTRLAAQQAGFGDLEQYLSGPTALIFCRDDAVNPAKVLEDFIKTSKTFKIKGGLFEGQVIDEASVKRMSSIPSREVLLSQLLGALIGPVTGFVRVLNAVPQGFVRALDGIAKKKEETQ